MKKSVLIATAVIAVLTTGQALAANLGISPANLAMTLATGESGSTTVLGSVNNPPPMPYNIAMQLRPVGGSLPASWLTTQPGMFTNRTAALLLTLTVRVPASAAPGAYAAIVQPVVMSSTIPLAPAAQPIQLVVTVTSKCAAAPSVSVSAAPAELKSPNGRLETVSVSGTVSVPEGCALARAWYALADEYGILGETNDVAVGADGSFVFTAPVQVSRRGDDKDGRLYQFTVYAADEAGTGASAPAGVTVVHDQRKER
jgi:hypothetical protein